jgi:peptide/nickel transport system substrate-binding protein
VRQALTHALERAELTRAVLGEYGVMADSWVQPGTPKYQALSPAVTRYPHDLRRAASLLDEAGWQLDQDGTRQKAGQRFHVSVRGNEDVVAIVADQWKTLGVTTRYESVPPQLARDREARASFRGFDVNTGPTALLNVVAKFSTDYIPTSENQWTGLNRGSYSNPAWDELGKSIFVTIDESKRLDMERELVRTYTGDLPSLPLYYGLEAVPVGGGLTGVQPILDTPHTGTILHTWNVHEWDLQPKS